MCVIRSPRSESARALIGAWTLSLLLFFGRATFGSLVKVLPGNGDLQMHRFMVGVDLAGVLFAGVGIVAVAQLIGLGLRRGLDRVHRLQARPVFVWGVVAVAVVAILAPAWTERARYDLYDGTLIPSQRVYEAVDGAGFRTLVEEAEARGDGRIYAGDRANWGQNYKIGSVPAYAELEDYDADAIGYPFRTVQSLSTDIEASFAENVPSQYQELNIKYMILPSDHAPPVPATLLDSQGRHRLYEVNTTGYFQVIDVMGSVTANRTNLGSRTNTFRYSDLATRNVYPSVAFKGAPAAAPTVAGTILPLAAPGSVLAMHNDAVNGVFTATVQANRPAGVLLKESFDPRWSVTVDGVAAKPVMIAPSFVGVEVPAGTHRIAFRYKAYSHYPLLVAIGVLTLLALALWPRRRDLARRRPFGREQGGPQES